MPPKWDLWGSVRTGLSEAFSWSANAHAASCSVIANHSAEHFFAATGRSQHAFLGGQQSTRRKKRRVQADMRAR